MSERGRRLPRGRLLISLAYRRAEPNAENGAGSIEFCGTLDLKEGDNFANLMTRLAQGLPFQISFERSEPII